MLFSNRIYWKVWRNSFNDYYFTLYTNRPLWFGLANQLWLNHTDSLPTLYEELFFGFCWGLDHDPLILCRLVDGIIMWKLCGKDPWCCLATEVAKNTFRNLSFRSTLNSKGPPFASFGRWRCCWQSKSQSSLSSPASLCGSICGKDPWCCLNHDPFLYF